MELDGSHTVDAIHRVVNRLHRSCCCVVFLCTDSANRKLSVKFKQLVERVDFYVSTKPGEPCETCAAIRFYAFVFCGLTFLINSILFALILWRL
jgi:hypothetical protein